MHLVGSSRTEFPSSESSTLTFELIFIWQERTRVTFKSHYNSQLITQQARSNGPPKNLLSHTANVLRGLFFDHYQNSENCQWEEFREITGQDLKSVAIRDWHLVLYIIVILVQCVVSRDGSTGQRWCVLFWVDSFHGNAQRATTAPHQQACPPDPSSMRSIIVSWILILPFSVVQFRARSR
jgi:hypothetical protein